MAEKKPRKTTPGPMKPPGDVVETKPVDERTMVEVKGRLIPVVKPTDEQIVAWWELVDQLQEHSPEVESLEKTMDLIKSMRIVIESVMPEKADRDWLARGRLSGELDIQDSIKIVVGSLEAKPRPRDPDVPVVDVPRL